MKKLNNYICFGLLFNSIFLLCNATNIVPEFIKGIFAALGITLIFVGMYSENHDINKLKTIKKNILQRITSK